MGMWSLNRWALRGDWERPLMDQGDRAHKGARKLRCVVREGPVDTVLEVACCDTIQVKAKRKGEAKQRHGDDD
jgi:hypothetical protein